MSATSNCKSIKSIKMAKYAFIVKQFLAKNYFGFDQIKHSYIHKYVRLYYYYTAKLLG